MEDSKPEQEVINQLIAAVAEKHKIIIDKDDPIFATITLNELILKRYLSQSKVEVDRLKESLIELYGNQEEYIKENVKSLINASKQTLSDSVGLASEELSKSILKQQSLIIEQNKNIRKEITNSMKSIRFARNSTLLLAVITLSAMCITLSVMLS